MRFLLAFIGAAFIAASAYLPWSLTGPSFGRFYTQWMNPLTIIAITALTLALLKMYRGLWIPMFAALFTVIYLLNETLTGLGMVAGLKASQDSMSRDLAGLYLSSVHHKFPHIKWALLIIGTGLLFFSISASRANNPEEKNGPTPQAYFILACFASLLGLGIKIWHQNYSAQSSAKLIYLRANNDHISRENLYRSLNFYNASASEVEYFSVNAIFVGATKACSFKVTFTPSKTKEDPMEWKTSSATPISCK